MNDDDEGKESLVVEISVENVAVTMLLPVPVVAVVGGMHLYGKPTRRFALAGALANLTRAQNALQTPKVADAVFVVATFLVAERLRV